jgi:hypothetical protein
VDEWFGMNHSTKHQWWSDVAVFEDVNAAKTIEAFLTGKGLEARTYDDKLFRYFLFLRPPRLTVRVQVRQENIQSADDFLEAAAPVALQEAIRCPSCNSLRISYPQMTRKFILPTILLHLGILLRVIGHQCYCEHCHEIWSLSGENVHAPMKPAKHFPL